MTGSGIAGDLPAERDASISVASGVEAGEAPRSSEAGRYEAFLSYSRKDAAFVAGRLQTELAARGKATWMDVAEISGGAQWRERVQRGIEACKALIFVVSPDAVASTACRQELDDAVGLSKLIIPVVYRDVPPDAMPQVLADTQWVFLREGDDQSAGMDRLVEALDADLEWRDQHTRLAGRAREWLDSGRDASYALRGSDLRQAEAWLDAQAGHRQAPTRQQSEFIAFSRRAASRRLYTLVGVLATALLAMIALTVVALVQRGAAIRETHIAQSQMLGTQAAGETDPELASLLGVGAHVISPTFDARNAVLTAMSTHEIGPPLISGTGVMSVASSPDGRTLASAGDDHTVRVWDVATHRQIGPPLTGDTDWVFSDWVFSVVFSPNGCTLASASVDGTIRLWDVATHRQIGAPFTDQPAGVNAVVFSPDGRTLASAGDDGTIRLWDVATHGQLGEPLTGNTDAVASVAFSPDGRTLASAGNDGTIRLWDLAPPGERAALLVGPGDAVPGVAFSPTGQTLASASVDDGTVRLWNLSTRRQLGSPLPGIDGPVVTVAFSPDGRTLASAEFGGSVRLWDVANQSELGAPLSRHTGNVESVAFSPDGRTLASAGDDGTARLWDVSTHRQLGPPLTTNAAIVKAVAFSPDGHTLAAVGEGNNNVQFWDVASQRQLLPPLTGHTNSVVTVAFSPDDGTVASAGSDGTIRLWDLVTHRQLGPPLTDGNNDTVESEAFSPDGRTLVLRSECRECLAGAVTPPISPRNR